MDINVPTSIRTLGLFQRSLERDRHQHTRASTLPGGASDVFSLVRERSSSTTKLEPYTLSPPPQEKVHSSP
ncbi:hypothetical protein CEXT_516561 [Caerostris extrusa]|uniref:Uncharacterized protein n=1 Tax=Caerostris extrusa TaxID=172846 RepID=A0AAV4PQE2_CAEEX|nr:hypothetical protein CEXT_516561 [Caerostris extrusa]